jgi:hypothetical protein
MERGGSDPEHATGDGAGFFDEGFADWGECAHPDDAEGDGGEVAEWEEASAFRVDGWGVDGEADAVAFGDVAGDEFDGTEFEARVPVDAAFAHFLLEETAHGVGLGEREERDVDAVVFPDFFSGGEAAFFGDDEGHGELDEFLFANAFGAFADEGGDADVDVLGEETLFELFEAAREERELEVGQALAEGAEDGREVLALNGFGAADAESGGCAAAEGAFDFGEA